MSVQVFFERGRYDIKPGFMENGESLSEFLTKMDSLSNRPDTQIDSVLIISSSSSPEGNSRMNAVLSDKRAAALQRLLEKNISEKNVRFVIRSAGEDWESLGLLLKDSGIKGREAAADIIGNTPEYIIENGQITGGRKKAMMDYDYGRLWWKMDEQLFPLLRQATVHVFHSKKPGALSSTELKVKGMDTPKQLAQQYVAAGVVRPLTRFTTTAGAQKPLFALKTNLLFDAASLLNLGAEFPIAQSFSVAAELYFPWWQNRSRDITIQMLGAEVEGRWWPGDRKGREPLTGFFAGVYGGAGYFDFQLGRLTGGRGVQGDFFLCGGLSAGYAHSIGRQLRLEYSLGAGYVSCNHVEYISVKDSKFGDIKVIPYPWESKRTTGILPTRASISLVWMLTTKKGGGR